MLVFGSSSVSELDLLSDVTAACMFYVFHFLDVVFVHLQYVVDECYICSVWVIVFFSIRQLQIFCEFSPVWFLSVCLFLLVSRVNFIKYLVFQVVLKM